MPLPRLPIARVSGPVERSRAVVIIPPKCRERFLVSKPSLARLFEEAGFVHAGLSDLVPPYEIQRYDSWHHVVLFTVGGEGRMTVGGVTHRLLPGSVCILPAWVDHRYVSTKSWRIVWFHPTKGSAWDPLIGSEFQLRPFLFGDRLATLADHLHTESLSEDSAAPSAVRLTFELVVHYLHRELQGSDTLHDREWRLKLECLWDEVRSAPRAWGVSSLSARVGCSRSQLHTLCRRFYSEGAGERLLRLRLQKGADLLTHTPWTLAEIAEHTGYSDVFAFSKAFRRWSGVAPAQFRKRAQAKAQAGLVLDKKT